MGYLFIDLESDVTLLVKITEKGHPMYKKIVRVNTTLNEVISSGVPDILIYYKVFECMGHPSDHYEIKGFITAPALKTCWLTEIQNAEFKEGKTRIEEKNIVTSEQLGLAQKRDPEEYERYVMGNWDRADLQICVCPAHDQCQPNCPLPKPGKRFPDLNL